MYLVAIGDSKTYGGSCGQPVGAYRPHLEAGLKATGNWGDVQFMRSYAAPGVTTAGAAAQIDAYIASMVEVEKVPEWALVNLGANDGPLYEAGNLVEATWKANTGYVLDAVHAKWPAAKVRVMRWIRTDTPLAMAALNDNWLPAVLATRAAWAEVGPDERTFLPGHLCDVTHADATGDALTAAEWQAAMGY